MRTLVIISLLIPVLCFAGHCLAATDGAQTQAPSSQTQEAQTQEPQTQDEPQQEKRLSGFLAVPFGTPKGEIKDIQGFTLVEQTETSWVYEGFWGEDPIKAVMSFEMGKLSRGDILLKDENPSARKCMVLFKKLVGSLSQQWGKPDDDRLQWHSESPPLETEEAMAKAMEQGEVSWLALWNLEDTTLKLTVGLNDQNKMAFRLSAIGPKE